MKDTDLYFSIQALIDDELDEREAKRILFYVENDEKAYEMYKEILTQKNLLNIWWQNTKTH